MTIATLLATMRLPFLVLTPACLAPGFAFAYTQSGEFDAVLAALILLAALCAHVSVNMFNEFLDYRSGLDAMTQRTPFSGGSGALLVDPGAARQVFLGAIASLIATILIGHYLVSVAGPLLLAIGLTGVAIILVYTRWLNRHAVLCLLAPGLAFGPLMIVGTVLVMTGASGVDAVLLSLPQFFMVNNLLLLNQIPDIEADAHAGRRHLPIRYGVDAALAVYLAFVVAAALVFPIGHLAGRLPLELAALAPAILVGGIIVFARTRQLHTSGRALTQALGMNVGFTIIISLLTAGLLIFAGAQGAL